MKKPFNLTCGSACVYYILKDSGIRNLNINKEMLWITELTKTLIKITKYDIKLICFNSELLNDYKAGKKEGNYGFFLLDKFYKSNNKIYEKRLTKKTLIEEISSSKYVIFNVDSKIFNKSLDLSGGHYIIVTQVIDDKVEVINPEKTIFTTFLYPIDDLLRATKNFGSWRILVK